MHLIVDAHTENKELMTNRELMEAWLSQVVEMAGMTVFGKPFIYGYPWPGSTDWTAITAFCPLMESHLSLHCWPERDFVFIDLFTCGELRKDVEVRVIDYILKTFRMQRPTIMLLDRGVNLVTSEIIPVKVRSN